MKKKTIIALMTAVSLLASCSKTAPAESTTEGTTEATTTEATEAATETTAAATPTPRVTVTPTPMPTSTPEPTPPGDVLTEGSDQYDMFMTKIDEIEASAPGQYSYRFSIEMNSCILTAFDGTEQTMYVIKDGEMTEYIPERPNYYASDIFMSYEDIREFPFLTNTWTSFDTLGEESVEFDTPVTSFVDSVPDGMYFGGLVGLSTDGTTALIIAATPISIDREEILALEEGDSIGYRDFTVEQIHYTEGSDYVQIDLSSESFNIGCLHLTNNNDADDSRLYLCEESNDWMLENAVIVQVPVSPSVELGGNYEIMLYGQEGYDPGDQEMTGNSLLDSSYWAYISDDENNYNYSSGTNNGWRDCCGGLEPVVIENGQITYMAIGYR